MVDQIGTGNPADELIGDDRPPSRRSSALLVVLVLVLGGYAVTRLLDPEDPPKRAPATAAPTATSAPAPPAALSSAIPSPYVSAYPASAEPTPAPAPWADLPVGRLLDDDLASGTVVRTAGRTVAVGTGVQVVEMHGADGGPVLLVQDRGTTAIEQLRPDGSRLVLEQFPYESRHPQGMAVDPSGSRVVYALTAKRAEGPYGLVVRDLRTGEVLVSRRTRLPFGVRSWTPVGVVLEVALDPGGPPYVWTPGAGTPVGLPRGEGDGGPFLLAASPVSGELALTDGSCVRLDTVGDPGRQFCGGHLGGPAAWSPDGRRLVGMSAPRRLTVLDVVTGGRTTLRLPRVFVRQVTWADLRTVLLAVTDRTGEQGAVLRCHPGGRCRLASRGALTRSPQLTLSR